MRDVLDSRSIRARLNAMHLSGILRHTPRLLYTEHLRRPLTPAAHADSLLRSPLATLTRSSASHLLSAHGPGTHSAHRVALRAPRCHGGSRQQVHRPPPCVQCPSSPSPPSSSSPSSYSSSSYSSSSSSPPSPLGAVQRPFRRRRLRRGSKRAKVLKRAETAPRRDDSEA